MILYQQFKQVVVLYGEDAEKTTVLDFFTIFSNFLTSFNVSHWCSEIVNWNLKFKTAYMAYSMVAKLIPLVTKYGVILFQTHMGSPVVFCMVKCPFEESYCLNIVGSQR